jgi:tRNA-splicing ligase RtcB (3'-phosphate/5'-hydroxy nucleic acid ligase)
LRLGRISGLFGQLMRGVESRTVHHGAGRARSRTEAQPRFTRDDHAKATAGVECRKDADLIDEIDKTPMAYKSIDAGMEAQRDRVDVVHRLRPVICIKG